MGYGKNAGKITRRGFNFVRGYYRYVYISTYKNNRKVKARVRKWIKPYYKRKKLKNSLTKDVLKVFKDKKKKSKKQIINSAIAHLNGYSVMVEAWMGFSALGVKETIKDLEGIK